MIGLDGFLIQRLHPKFGMLLLTLCCFLLSWAFSFNHQVAVLEGDYYRQLLSLLPSFQQSLPMSLDEMSPALQQLALLAAFILIGLNLLFIN